MTFSEALEHVSSPSSHSTNGTEAGKITEPTCTGTNQTEPICTESTQITEPSINCGTSPNSVSANNHDLSEKKLVKLKINVNAGTTENVNGSKKKKKGRIR